MSGGRQAERRMREQERLSGIMPLTRELGGFFEHSRPMDEPQAIDTPMNRPRRRDLWSPEAWAEMQAIWNTPDPFEAGPIARRGNEESERG